jgi:uncharacterized protein
MSREATRRRAPVPAASTGAAVGILGGLLGLGGAEFRLPILVGYFRYPLLRAISLNLAVSLVTVVVSVATRLIGGGQRPDLTALPVAGAMAIGGMAGAALAGRWLAHVSEARLRGAVRTLLIGIGLLLMIEAMTGWHSPGMPLGPGLQVSIGLGAGLLIGMISTILGVAGGELIIPTLTLGFGIPIKVAGTLSLLISIPTILIGLDRHRARGAFRSLGDVRRLALPMGVGTAVGSIAGGLLVAYVPAAGVKLLLGVVLIASALRAFDASPSR